MHLEVWQLELLLAVEQAGSITGAARALGFQQPHISRQLMRIEAELGYPVFTRDAAGTVVTPAGAAVLRQARDAVRAVAAVNAQQATRPAGPFHLIFRGLHPISTVEVLAELCPELEVSSSHADPDAGRAALLDGTADLFLAIRIPHEEWPEPAPLIEREVLFDDTVVLMSTHHPLAGKEEIDLTELADADWITGTSPGVIRMVREECRLLGGFEPRLPYRTTDNNGMNALLSQGHGVMFGARSVSQRRGFVARPYRGATPAQWLMLHRPGVLPTAVLAQIAVAMRAMHERHVAQGVDAERAQQDGDEESG